MFVIPAIYKNNVKYSGSSSSSNIDITTTLTEDTVSDTSVPSSKAVYSIVDNLQTELNNVIDDNNEINNNLAQLIKTTTVTASADIAANSSAFISVSPPETPSGYRRLFAFIQGGSGSIDTSQLLVGSGTNGCRVYNNLPQKQTVTIECRIVYIKNC